MMLISAALICLCFILQTHSICNICNSKIVEYINNYNTPCQQNVLQKCEDLGLKYFESMSSGFLDSSSIECITARMYHDTEDTYKGEVKIKHKNGSVVIEHFYEREDPNKCAVVIGKDKETLDDYFIHVLKLDRVFCWYHCTLQTAGEDFAACAVPIETRDDPEVTRQLHEGKLELKRAFAAGGLDLTFDSFNVCASDVKDAPSKREL